MLIFLSKYLVVIQKLLTFAMSLRDKGFKVTPQRLAIYSVLASTKAHPSAEMIFNDLQALYPTMSLATVYKTIDILREIGLVQILNAGEDCFRYDANTQPHPHVRCTCCGRVDDIMDLSTDSLEAQAASETGYQIEAHQYYFFGVCPSCQGQKKL